jgi:hypothetical protein
MTLEPARVPWSDYPESGVEKIPDTERVPVPHVVRMPKPDEDPDTEREPATKRPWDLTPPSDRGLSFDDLLDDRIGKITQ